MTYYVGTVPVTPYMEHFGILGMKWGLRRYQNEDGTLTSAGKTRYKVASGSERETLKNLKKIKNDPSMAYRRKIMSKRQKMRLDKDIDFYEKRLKGEVKKKNIISRLLDNDRSKSLKNRATNALAISAVRNVGGEVVSHIIAKRAGISLGSLSSPPKRVGRIIKNTISDTGSELLVSELYNRAVGRY